MPEIHLKQPGFTYSACVTFTINKERIQKFKETSDARYIYKNQLDKACFEHVMVYGDFKDLARRTVSNRVLRDKSFNIGKNPNYDEYQRGLASLVVVLKMNLNKMNNWLKNYSNQLLKNLTKEKYIHHLKTIFGVLI